MATWSEEPTVIYDGLDPDTTDDRYWLEHPVIDAILWWALCAAVAWLAVSLVIAAVRRS